MRNHLCRALFVIGFTVCASTIVSAQTDALSFRPIDTGYSSSLDRIVAISADPNQLHIYDPAAHYDQIVSLTGVPLQLSVSPDGSHASVSYNGSVSYVNLSSGVIEKTFTTGLNPYATALSNTYLYEFGSTPSSGYGAVSINLSSNAQTATTSYYSVYGPATGRVHPSGRQLYVTSYNLTRFDISSGLLGTSTQSSYYNCPGLWLSPDGSRMYNGCGSILQHNDTAELDMSYLSSFPNLTAVQSLSEGPAIQQIAAIPSAQNNYYTLPQSDSEVRLYTNNYFQQIGRLAIPSFSAGSKTYAAHGKWVFYRSDASAIYVVNQADSTSGLLYDFAIQTYPIGNPPACSATLSTSAATTPATGGMGTVNITAAADCLYTATSDSSWLQVLSGGRGSGNNALTYLARANATGSSRTGTITVAGQTLTVTQSAAGTLAVLQQLPYKVVDAAYSKALDRIVAVTSTPNELHVYDPTTGTDQAVSLVSAPLAVSVRPDGLYAAVGQDGWISSVNLQTVSVDKVIPVGMTVQHLVLAGNGYAYLSTKQISGLSSVQIGTGAVTPSTNGSCCSNGGVVRLHPSGNYVYGSSGKWDISGGVAKVAAGSNYNGPGVNFWITEDGARIFTSAATVLRSSDVPSQDLAPNGSLSNASQVTWASHSLIEQTTAVIPQTYCCGSSTGDDTSVQFYSDSFLGFAGQYSLPQFTVGSQSFKGHGKFVFWNAAANAVVVIEEADSTAQLTSDYAVTVIPPNSTNNGCGYALGSNSNSLPTAGGTGTVTMTTGASCVWMASSSAPWLTVTAGNFSAGSQTVSYSVAPNYGPARSANLTIGGQTFAVSQAASPCTFSLGTQNLGFPSQGGSGGVTVTTQSGCGWTTVNNNPDWITITAGFSGSGSGSVSYSVAANTAQQSRTGSLTIAGQTYTVTQQAAPACAYSLSTTSTSLTSVAAATSVTVNTTSGCAWAAASNASWLTITGGASGSGTGSVSISALSNSSTLSRTGTLTIAGQTFTVTQAGLPSAASAPSLTGSATAIPASGSTMTLSLSVNVPTGSQNLGVVNVLINNALSSPQGCYLAYSASDNVLYLVADNGDPTQVTGKLMTASSGTLSNSQCTVNVAGSTKSISSNIVTLQLSLSFSPTFTGNKVIYVAARDNAGGNSGWQTVGVHQVPGAVVTYPLPQSVSTQSATGSGISQTFTFTYQDATSASNLQTVWALIRDSIDSSHACFVAYYRPGNMLYLYPDNGDGTQATVMTLSGTSALSNSQCTVSAQGATAQMSGNTLTLKLPITFTSAFAGYKGIWTAALTMPDAQNHTHVSNWEALGSWLVPAQ